MHASLRLLLPAALGLSSLVPFATGQMDDRAILERDGDARVDAECAGTERASATNAPGVFTGYVLEPDGAPAAGAVVVTSAGGEAVTAVDGSFQLEVAVPLDAESVQLTAVAAGRAGAASLIASIRVAWLGAPWSTTSVGKLVLASTSGCEPTWLPTFGGEPGVSSGAVAALAVFDDGSGPALYVGGGFSSVGGVAANSIAKWDGTSWSALGSGASGVSALTVFDDGSGPALYAGGGFTSAGGVAANRVAKWNGTSWSALGSGVTGGPLPTPAVSALTVFDDGSGPALYAGGSFTTAGGVAANHIAKWNGTSWSALGSGMTSGSFNPSVSALAVFNDGSGDALYAGGRFALAGGFGASSIAKWNGTNWSAVGGGLGVIDVFGDDVAVALALTVFDDGSGPALFVGGGFEKAGPVDVNNIAKWNGTTWTALGNHVSGPVYCLGVFDAGSGPELFAGGFFTTAGSVVANHIAKWNGTTWAKLQSGMTGTVSALTVFDDGGGAALYVGGQFAGPVGVPATSIAQWDGTSWSALSIGMKGNFVALTVFDDGSGEALYAGGTFNSAGGVFANKIAKWNGTSWSPLGSGVVHSNPFATPRVLALTVFDDGNGAALYAGGEFTTAGGVAANYIAKWDGTSWSPLGSGMNDVVEVLTVFDDGNGAALYAGGDFTTAGGVAANRIAKWNGTSWSALGSGLSGGSFFPSVRALTAFDDGSGPALYAGGFFTAAGGIAANRIAKWNGTTWSALGSGMDNLVLSLAGFDDGTGAALYAGGDFTTAGGIAANRIAKWNGTSWSALGSGVSGGGPTSTPSVSALTVFNDGGGEALYAGGLFTTAGGIAANHIAKWSGTGWSALGSGMSHGPSSSDPTVVALAVFNDGGGEALYAGGNFFVSPGGDSYLAKWGCSAISSVPGCAGNPAKLTAQAPCAPLGAPLPLLITGSAATTGVALLYFGAPGFDANGCGVDLSGLGELLLAVTPTPIEIASGVLAAGSCSLAPTVPNIPALLGLTAHLQGAAIHLLAPQLVEPTNALAVTLGP